MSSEQQQDKGNSKHPDLAPPQQQQSPAKQQEQVSSSSSSRVHKQLLEDAEGRAIVASVVNKPKDRKKRKRSKLMLTFRAPTAGAPQQVRFEIKPMQAEEEAKLKGANVAEGNGRRRRTRSSGELISDEEMLPPSPKRAKLAKESAPITEDANKKVKINEDAPIYIPDDNEEAASGLLVLSKTTPMPSPPPPPNTDEAMEVEPVVTQDTPLSHAGQTVPLSRPETKKYRLLIAPKNETPVATAAAPPSLPPVAPALPPSSPLPPELPVCQQVNGINIPNTPPQPPVAIVPGHNIKITQMGPPPNRPVPPSLSVSEVFKDHLRQIKRDRDYTQYGMQIQRSDVLLNRLVSLQTQEDGELIRYLVDVLARTENISTYGFTPLMMKRQQLVRLISLVTDAALREAMKKTLETTTAVPAVSGQ